MIQPRQTAFPRWRGFNLLNMFNGEQSDIFRPGFDMRNSPGRFLEEDFQMIAELGFNFVRLPLNYRFWIQNGDPFELDESKLEAVDEAVRLGEKYGIHVNIGMHRGPGYCILDPIDPTIAEPFDLWHDPRAEEAFLLHWKTFARRYKGISSERVSFNPINEPQCVTPEDHARVMTHLVDAVQAIDPQRAVILDGLNTGNSPAFELGYLGARQVGQACRGYLPNGVTHYGVGFIDPKGEFPAPQWPGAPHNHTYFPDARNWDHDLLRQHFLGWAAFSEAFDCGVCCTECGCQTNTPHDVCLAWLDDFLGILEEFQIGFALWNFKGKCGVLESERPDVDYEDFHGYRLDRGMLDVLQRH